jgi:putative hydroxymethylpyrimidine transport system substrate-binding protein
MLDWFVNPQHAPIIIAQEQGFFAAQGLQVDIVAPSDPADPPKLVAAGKADIAVDYQPELMLQVNSGLPIIRIGTLVNKPLRATIVLAESPIHSLADFAHKTIGYSMSGVGTAILATMLRYHQVDPNSVELIDVHYDLVQALLSKKVDAVSDIERNFEIPEIELTGKKVRAFYPEDNGVPTFDELIFVANRQRINDPRLKKFLIALQQALNYMDNHPTQSWQLLIKHHPELNNQLNKIAWQLTLPYFARDPAKLDSAKYKKFTQWLVNEKLLKKTLPLDHYAIEFLNPLIFE